MAWRRAITSVASIQAAKRERSHDVRSHRVEVPWPAAQGGRLLAKAQRWL
jgi:hypothetical protein